MPFILILPSDSQGSDLPLKKRLGNFYFLLKIVRLFSLDLRIKYELTLQSIVYKSLQNLDHACCLLCHLSLLSIFQTLLFYFTYSDMISLINGFEFFYVLWLVHMLFFLQGLIMDAWGKNLSDFKTSNFAIIFYVQSNHQRITCI